MLLLSMRCIADAFGKHGYTNVHSHELRTLTLPLFFDDVVTHSQRCRDGT
jgi:hypothetical protein